MEKRIHRGIEALHWTYSWHMGSSVRSCLQGLAIVEYGYMLSNASLALSFLALKIAPT